MYVLTIKEDGKKDVYLARGVTSIGRASDNDIVLPIKGVSAYHAKIVTFTKIAYIQDLCSTNGTYVNGKLTHYHVLQPGDYVSIGGCYIYIDDYKEITEPPIGTNDHNNTIRHISELGTMALS